jgi:uncharacterized protein involved in response to NO
MVMTALLAYPFRPFFLLVGLYAVLVMLGWSGYLFAAIPLPIAIPAAQWHSHEMLYGLVPAAMAGFLLTAITNWTAASAVRGGWLLALILLWLCGRSGMALAGLLEPWLVGAVDVGFLGVLAIYVAGVVLRYRNYRNLVLVAVIVTLALGNLLMHVGFARGEARWLQMGQRLGLDVIALMMAVIAGRITPAFSRNWLRLQGGDPALVRQWPYLDQLALASIALLAPLDVLVPDSDAVPLAALAAGLLNGLRLLQWSAWRVLREPLLWILHLAYLWIVVALVLRGSTLLGAGFSSSLWQHALGVGGIGVLVLGVMTRVAVGHTGRPLRLLPLGLWIYFAINTAALLRLLAAGEVIDYRTGILLAAAGWIIAFGLYVVLYWPVLSRPRPDGKPG